MTEHAAIGGLGEALYFSAAATLSASAIKAGDALSATVKRVVPDDRRAIRRPFFVAQGMS
jgi:hypothetical protein